MNTFLENNIWILIVSIVWVLPWKGYALWIASERKSKAWFIALLVLNTFAILEIFYIFYIVKKTPKQIIKSFKSKI
jgi:hypothetical protein